jgi:hypothetical protein
MIVKKSLLQAFEIRGFRSRRTTSKDSLTDLKIIFVPRGFTLVYIAEYGKLYPGLKIFGWTCSVYDLTSSL